MGMCLFASVFSVKKEGSCLVSLYGFGPALSLMS